jgi:hypothetical protein
MPSLTPLDKREDVASEAFQEGLMNGFFTMIPCMGAMYFALQSPKFRARTNVQSRTAMVIMPALFVFAFTSEEKVVHRMKEIAKESQHSHDSVQWAQRQLTKKNISDTAEAKELADLYRRAVYESGVRVIPGDRLGFHHIMANYVAENPFKVLATLAVPGVAWIFYGRTGQEHLTFSMKLMHTRVFGQFATLSTLLGVMGFKEMMDRNGRFITEAQAEQRVEEMQELRNQMFARLEQQNKKAMEQQAIIQKAHDADVKEGHVHEHVQHKKKGKKAKKEAVAEETSTVSA